MPRRPPPHTLSLQQLHPTHAQGYRNPYYDFVNGHDRNASSRDYYFEGVYDNQTPPVAVFARYDGRKRKQINLLPLNGGTDGNGLPYNENKKISNRTSPRTKYLADLMRDRVKPHYTAATAVALLDNPAEERALGARG